MKILVTGAGGQLGKEWDHRLKEGKTSHKSCDSAALNITDYSRVVSVLEDEAPDVLINCAAYTAVDEAEDERIRAEQINHTAVAGLAKACKKQGIKLVHYSTDYVFPGTAAHKDRFVDGYTEDAKTDPVNYYGQTKWEGEQAIRNSGCDFLIIRISWLCGAYGSNFVKTMLRLAKEKTSLRVVGDQWGSPTFSHDVVTNTLKLLELGLGGTYHLTSEGVISWAEFAQTIFELTEKNVNIMPIPSEEYPTKAKRPKFSKLNTQKADCVEGIIIKNWKDGLQNLLDQIENH